MKCIEYVISVCDSTMDFVHGEGRQIREIYSKECDLFVNEDGHIFQMENPESRFSGLETKEIDVVMPFLMTFKDSIKMKETVDIYIKEIFKEKE